MVFKVILPCKSFITVNTLIRFLSSVRMKMFLRMIFPCKVSLHSLHLKGFSPVCVCEYMSRKAITYSKSFITFNTLIWFLSSVCLKMLFKNVFPCKSFITFNTLIRIFFSVCLKMFLRISSLANVLLYSLHL